MTETATDRPDAGAGEPDFSQLGLSEKVQAAVRASGYTKPTPIQAKAIPEVLSRRDLVGIAQTGTGKTASFVLPMLTILEKGRARVRMPRTLILEPTRELAAQVEENFNKYGQNHRLTVALLIGGVSFDEQDRKLGRGADVLIATPGRLLDHFERGKLLLNGVEVFVIDEADRMLDMGFIPDIERIIKLLPVTRQTMLFSATMPTEIQRLADKFLTRPVRVEVSRPASTSATIEQLAVSADRDPAAKRERLRGLLRNTPDIKNAIIFSNRKRDVAVLARSLQRHGFSAGELHGDMDQHARLAMLDGFRKGELTFLVASDVAARGLDIPDVSHVFNFDVPTHPEDYVHRIGRTGRAGRKGAAITLVTPPEGKYIAQIEKLIGQPIPVEAGAAIVTGGDAGEGRGDRRRGGRGRGERAERPRRERSQDHGTTEAAAPAAEAAAQTERQEPREKPRQKPRGDERQRTAKSRDRQANERHESQARPAPQPIRPGGPSAQRGPVAQPEPSRQQRHGGGRNQRDLEQVGLGDHVPDFLRRPVRPPSSSST